MAHCERIARREQSAQWAPRQLRGDDGMDRLDSGSGNDRLYGGAMADMLMGKDGADRLDAGAGHDMLEGGRGNDTLIGGPGADAFIVDPMSGNDVVFDLGDRPSAGRVRPCRLPRHRRRGAHHPGQEKRRVDRLGRQRRRAQ